MDRQQIVKRGRFQRPYRHRHALMNRFFAGAALNGIKPSPVGGGYGGQLITPRCRQVGDAARQRIR